MRYLSMFSGIEAASVAWKPLGWKAAAVCEIDKFASAVLAHHFPTIPNLGDVTKANFDEIGPINLAVFGSPCQSFSIAGKRLGLDDPRGNLALIAGRIVYKTQPAWFVFENVPGLLSSDAGRDFGTLLAAFSGHPSGSVFAPPAGGWPSSGIVVQANKNSYGLAWRVLDAQFFGLAQRRKRVFVVGYSGDWRPAAAVLFERESLSGHPAPRRKAGKGFTHSVAPSLTSSGRGVERAGETRGQDPVVAVAFGGNRTSGPIDVAASLGAHSGPCGRMDFGSETFIAFDTTQITSKANYSNPQPGDPSHPLTSGGHPPSVAFSIMPQNSGRDYKAREVEVSQPVLTSGPTNGNQGGDFVVSSRVRRLTPTECERLQGFPDGFTDIPWRGKSNAPDGPRYKALGNSMAVPCMAWIGRRIQMVEEMA
jgi:DNA (cytosine-5)-methyltransferase 1